MSARSTPDPDHLDDRDEGLVSDFADRLATPTPATFEFMPPSEDEDPVASAVFQALGAASMCWSSTPTGVFASERAREIGEALIARVKAVSSSAEVRSGVDDEVFHYRVEFEGPDSVTCLILADNEQPALYLDEDARTISVKVGDRVEAIISRRRFVAMFRVGCSGDDDNGGGGEDPDGPDDGPDGPDLDGLAAWVDGDGITHLRTDQGTSSIMGRRDEVTERRAA